MGVEVVHSDQPVLVRREKRVEKRVEKTGYSGRAMSARIGETNFDDGRQSGILKSDSLRTGKISEAYICY